VRVTILDGSSNARDGDITCFHPLVLPDDIIPISDAVEAGKQVAEAIDNGSALDWRRAPLKDTQILDVIGFELPIEIASVVSDQQWVRLSNTIRVTVSVHREVAEKVNIIRSCQGSGEIRNYPIISLNSNARQYTVEAVYSGADFFTLMPGELEEFHMKFRCDSPGVYTIRMELPYRYGDQSDTIIFSHADLVCPVSYFKWSRYPDPPNKLIGGEFYVWNEGDYEPKSP